MGVPTADQYGNWLDYQLDQAIKRTKREVEYIRRKLSPTGHVGGGYELTSIADALGSGLDQGIDLALSELKRGIGQGWLDQRTLREQTHRALSRFGAQMRLIWPYPGEIDPALTGQVSLEQRVERAMEWWEAGLLDPTASTVPLTMTNNTIHIGAMNHGAIQQGSAGATQTVLVGVDIDAAKRASEEIERLAGTLPEEIAGEVRAEIATINAQLTKKSPSTTILREAGSTLRDVTTGAVGGAMAPGLLSAVQTLLAALGVS